MGDSINSWNAAFHCKLPRVSMRELLFSPSPGIHPIGLPNCAVNMKFK